MRELLRLSRVVLLLALLATLLPFPAIASPAGAEKTPPVSESAKAASISAREAEALPGADPGDIPGLLRLRVGAFDPLRGEPALAETTRASLSQMQSGLRLVQFPGPILDEWYTALESSGLKIVAYIPDNAYLVWGDGVAIETVRKFAPLHWVGLYHPFYALHPALAQKADLTERVKVTVQVYAHSGADAIIKEILARATVLRAPHAALVYRNMQIEIAAADLEWLAALPGVVNVEPAPEYHKLDEIQGQIMAGNLNTAGIKPAGTGYLAWLDSLSFSTTPGDYPIVDVTDDGIDDGDATPTHADFYTFGNVANPDRLVYNYNGTTDASADGGGGHGNLNASLVAGYNARTGYPYEDADGYNYGLGVNPYGRVAGSKVFANAGSWAYTGSYADLIGNSYTLGARISSNSWGADSGGEYTTDCQEYDALVRDALSGTAGNQQMIVLFSAGNAGAGDNTIGSPGAAKNVITVGASENYRPLDTDGCNTGPTGADAAQDMIDFSSRGPTDDSRIKPDLVAPGTHVMGAASQSTNFDGQGVCGVSGGMYYPTSPVQTLYTWSSGTSHSTPAVAGATSLIYRYYQDTYGGAAPSPAMMKAYLVNATSYMEGVDAGDTLPSKSQGYGLVNLSRAFDYAGVRVLDQTQVLAATNATYNVSGVVADTGKPFRVVLAWTDAPGATTGNAYVNNLDLEVQIGGQTYRGNVFSGGVSIAGGAADPRNNVESVFLPAGVSGAFTVTVKAANIAGDGVPGNADTSDQDFALVVYNTANASNPIGFLAGTVTNSGGAPISDAHILTNRVTVQAETGVDGKYSIMTKPDTYSVTAQAYGYQSQAVSGVVVSANTTTTQNFMLTAVPTYVLTGTVTDATTGWPLYAAVEIDPDGAYPAWTVWTNPWTGVYSVTLMGNYSHTLTVAPWSGIPGYVAQSRVIRLNAARTNENFALSADIAACEAPGYVQLGLSEGFESTTFPPTGWARFRGVNGVGTVQDWKLTTTTYQGTGAAYVRYENVTGGPAQDWLVTPKVRPITGGATLRFYMRQEFSGAYGTTYTVRVSTNSQTTPADFTTVKTYGEVDFGITYAQFAVDLSAYVNQDIYIAFVMEQDNGDSWYLDNVEMLTCAAPTGGLVAGHVYDANTGDGIAGATVSNQSGYAQTTRATLDDAATDEGFYVLYAPAGSETLTATLAGYTAAVVNGVSVAASKTVRQDFLLVAGHIVAAPARLHAWVQPGGATAKSFTLTNDGGGPATFNLVEVGGVANQIVQDGGFEQGTPNPDWSEYSSNGYALITTDLPRSGSYGVWIGGATNETAALTQTLTLPQGTATLTFWLAVGVEGSGSDADDWMRVSLDTHPLFTVNGSQGAAYGSFVQVTADVSAYADGGAHQLHFNSYNDSATYSNFFVDDVALDVVPVIAWLSETPVSGALGATGGAQAIQATFNAGALTSGAYAGVLRVTSDTPYAPQEIPVRLFVGGTFVSQQTGVWSGSAWSSGAPAASDWVTITTGHTVTVDSAAASCYGLTIMPGATLVVPNGNQLTVEGEVRNNGALRQSRNLSGSGDVDFHVRDSEGNITYHGLQFKAGFNLGATQVDIHGGVINGASTLNQTLGRWFDITPQNALSDVAVVFYYREAELNGNIADALNVYHFRGQGAWDAMATLARGGSGDARWVEAAIGPDFSPFVLKSANAPTVVSAAALRGHGNIPIFLLAFLAVGALIAHRKQRRT